MKRERYAYSGQSEPGEEAFDVNIPHWDRAAHRRTQDGLEGRASNAAARRASRRDDGEDLSGGVWLQFTLVSSVVIIGVVVPTVLWSAAR